MLNNPHNPQDSNSSGSTHQQIEKEIAVRFICETGKIEERRFDGLQYVILTTDSWFGICDKYDKMNVIFLILANKIVLATIEDKPNKLSAV